MFRDHNGPGPSTVMIQRPTSPKEACQKPDGGFVFFSHHRGLLRRSYGPGNLPGAIERASTRSV
jgi:hypothetical protein